MNRLLRNAALLLTGLLAPVVGQAGQAVNYVADVVLTPAATATVTVSQALLPAVRVDAEAVEELSGLAWSGDDQLLYAVSDQGDLFHLQLQLDGARLVAVTPLRAVAITDPDGKVPQYRKFNAEGLALLHGNDGQPGNTILVIALEGGTRPGIVRVAPDGHVLGGVAVPPPIADYAAYDDPDRGLEAVTFLPQRGLLTAPEAPLTQSRLHTLHAGNQHWSFRRYAPDNRLKGMVALADGNVLVLERSELSDNDLKTATVRLINLAACDDHRVCASRDIAVLPAGPDNFEGMARLDADHVLIVSDQGGHDDRQTRFIMLSGLAPADHDDTAAATVAARHIHAASATPITKRQYLSGKPRP